MEVEHNLRESFCKFFVLAKLLNTLLKQVLKQVLNTDFCEKWIVLKVYYLSVLH